MPTSQIIEFRDTEAGLRGDPQKGVTSGSLSKFGIPTLLQAKVDDRGDYLADRGRSQVVVPNTLAMREFLRQWDETMIESEKPPVFMQGALDGALIMHRIYEGPPPSDDKNGKSTAILDNFATKIAARAEFRFGYLDDTGVACAFGCVSNANSRDEWVFTVIKNAAAKDLKDRTIITFVSNLEFNSNLTDLDKKQTSDVTPSDMQQRLRQALNSERLSRMFDGVVDSNGRIDLEMAVAFRMLAKTVTRIRLTDKQIITDSERTSSLPTFHSLSVIEAHVRLIKFLREWKVESSLLGFRPDEYTREDGIDAAVEAVRAKMRAVVKTWSEDKEGELHKYCLKLLERINALLLNPKFPEKRKLALKTLGAYISSFLFAIRTAEMEDARLNPPPQEVFVSGIPRSRLSSVSSTDSSSEENSRKSSRRGSESDSVQVSIRSSATPSPVSSTSSISKKEKDSNEGKEPISPLSDLSEPPTRRHSWQMSSSAKEEKHASAVDALSYEYYQQGRIDAVMQMQLAIATIRTAFDNSWFWQRGSIGSDWPELDQAATKVHNFAELTSKSQQEAQIEKAQNAALASIKALVNDYWSKRQYNFNSTLNANLAEPFAQLFHFMAKPSADKKLASLNASLFMTQRLLASWRNIGWLDRLSNWSNDSQKWADLQRKMDGLDTIIQLIHGEESVYGDEFKSVRVLDENGLPAVPKRLLVDEHIQTLKKRLAEVQTIVRAVPFKLPEQFPTFLRDANTLPDSSILLSFPDSNKMQQLHPLPVEHNLLEQDHQREEQQRQSTQKEEIQQSQAVQTVSQPNARETVQSAQHMNDLPALPTSFSLPDFQACYLPVLKTSASESDIQSMVVDDKNEEGNEPIISSANTADTSDGKSLAFSTSAESDNTTASFVPRIPPSSPRFMPSPEIRHTGMTKSASDSDLLALDKEGDGDDVAAEYRR